MSGVVTAKARAFDGHEQAGRWMRETFGAWADELSEAEHGAVRYYASRQYQALNLALRRHRALDSDQQRHVAALDRALRVPLREPIIAWRGLEFDRPVDFDARAGQPVVFPAYVSTSLLRPIAEGFCALAPTNHHAVLFEVALAPGTLVGCPDLVQPTLEAELLLARRQPMRLGRALAPAPARRYWTVALHVAGAPLTERPGIGVQQRVEHRLPRLTPPPQRATRARALGL